MPYGIQQTIQQQRWCGADKEISVVAGMAGFRYPTNVVDKKEKLKLPGFFFPKKTVKQS
jgi:hypothetical protein